MRVHFEKTGGHLPITFSADVDAQQLSPEEAAHLRQLVSGAQFEAIRAEPVTQMPEGITYNLVVTTDDGKRNEVLLAETSVPEQLRPLLRWLAKRAKPQPLT